MTAAVLMVVLSAGCAFLDQPDDPALRRFEHTALLNEIRAFERMIGFEETPNFSAFSGEEGYAFCGYVSAFYLPYSYEDPAIRWFDSISKEKCHELAGDADVHFGAVEVQGEGATPVTTSLAEGAVDRFVYVVIHENCHDQFDFPYGIEEALCNLIAYKGMIAFGSGRFGTWATQTRAMRRYVDGQVRHARIIIGYYEKLAAIYGRHHRGEITAERLLEERGAVFRHAERTLGWQRGDMNNVVMANEMTYRRHYPFLEGVYDALGQDLRRSVGFFRHVDRIKPSRAAVMERHGIKSADSVEFVRAYEEAVVEAMRSALPQARADAQAGR